MRGHPDRLPPAARRKPLFFQSFPAPHQAGEVLTWAVSPTARCGWALGWADILSASGAAPTGRVAGTWPIRPYSPARTVTRFPLIRPDVPPLADWTPILEEAYRERRFTNFGPLSRRLELLLCETWGGPETVCISTSSGTAALAAPLIARGVSGRVILPAFTFPATLSAIRMAGAEPLLVDVNPRDWRLDVDTLRRAFDATAARSAIVLCPFGLRSDFGSHARLVADRDGTLVVDNAAGLGVAGRPVQVSPHAFEACSLHATKPFAVGEGGLVFAHRSQEEDLRRSLNFGLRPGSPTDLRGWGINGKLSELHAAVGLAAACGFEERLSRRRALVAGYSAEVSGREGVEACTDVDAGAWQFFPVLLPDAEAAERFVAEAAARGMETRRYYAPALSTLPEVDRLGPCPVAEDLSARMCCVPVYSNASDTEACEMVAVFGAAITAALALNTTATARPA
jgi:dTDP-4-amino-4,6-dideoxygalactose transaminase